MILDSSAIVAVIRGEYGHDRLIRAMRRAPSIAVGAPTLTETEIALSRFGHGEQARLCHFLEQNGVRVISFDRPHGIVASQAHALYGKGHDPARLNLGDCMSYATARIADAPLLFIGEDFAKTDLKSAV